MRPATEPWRRAHVGPCTQINLRVAPSSFTIAAEKRSAAVPGTWRVDYERAQNGI